MWNVTIFCNTRSQTVFILQRTIPAKYVPLPPLDNLVMSVNTLHSKEIKHIYSTLVNTYVQPNRKQRLLLIMLKTYWKSNQQLLQHLFKVQQSFRPLDNESLGMILWRLQKMLTVAALYWTKRKNKEKQ